MGAFGILFDSKHKRLNLLKPQFISASFHDRVLAGSSICLMCVFTSNLSLLSLVVGCYFVALGKLAHGLGKMLSVLLSW